MVKRKTYIICHLVLETDALGLEELFERLLLLAVKVSEDSIGTLVQSSIPVDVAELVLSQAILQANVISNVLLADTAPPTRDMVIMATFSSWM